MKFNKSIKQKYILIVLGLLILLISGIFFTNTGKFNCPDTELFNFNKKVNNKEEATILFKSFFSEEKGYPPFDENKIISPEENIDPSMKNSYVYMDRYGYNGVGGVLYDNGKLVQKGYCK